LLRIVSRALATPHFLIAVFQNLSMSFPFWKHDYAINVLVLDEIAIHAQMC